MDVGRGTGICDSDFQKRGGSRRGVRLYFCHNEALLYEAIELYAPELFERIQHLVKRGKWRIMGGWYLQPDCLMPCGETIVRQIAYGRKYFKEKFDSVPEIATNFDSFGHSIGLVQILAKTDIRDI